MIQNNESLINLLTKNISTLLFGNNLLYRCTEYFDPENLHHKEKFFKSQTIMFVVDVTEQTSPWYPPALPWLSDPYLIHKMRKRETAES